MQAVAGLLSDARQVVDIARDEASNYRSQKGGNIPLKVLEDILYINYDYALCFMPSKSVFGIFMTRNFKV